MGMARLSSTPALMGWKDGLEETQLPENAA
jgi:hypothetical protein